MRITYDRDADAAYIRLGEAGSAPRRRTTRAELPDGINGFITLDWDGTRLVGIEILDASSRLTPAVLDHADDPD